MKPLLSRCRFLCVVLLSAVFFPIPAIATAAAAPPATTTKTISFSVAPDGGILNAATGEIVEESQLKKIRKNELPPSSVEAAGDDLLPEGVVHESPSTAAVGGKNTAVPSADHGTTTGEGNSKNVGDVEQETQNASKSWWSGLSNYMSGKRKKKSTFLAPFPYLVKFFFFWWCAILLSVVLLIVLDHLYLRYVKKKGHPVEWLCQVQLPVPLGAKSANSYKDVVFDLLTDVPSWDAETHPTLKYAKIVGEKQKLEQVGQVMHLCSKDVELSEEERRESIITRKLLEYEKGTKLVMQTLNDASVAEGGFTTVSKTKISIELSTGTSSASGSTSSSSSSSSSTEPSATSTQEGEQNKSQSEARPPSGDTNKQVVTAVVAGTGETGSRLISWWFRLARQQEDGIFEYFGELKLCADKVFSQKYRCKASTEGVSMIRPPT
ncbi:unnamed protein product [Amoebophrya sp. A120]|nr:unnamed protein product [Amoebophrya sp. A120]|eukprot:GSA120T00017745001.1